MTLSISSLIKRDITLGPENPAVVGREMMNLIQKSMWKLELSLALSGCASGLIVAFLLGVFIWRRSLVNRVSLRLMFAISLIDFITNIIQINPSNSVKSGASCRTYRFFLLFGMFTSVYLSSSIAMNLYMVFLRKNRSSVPRYVEYLYFIVPIAVGLLHFMPQQIWSATHGYCQTGDPVMTGTRGYVLHFFFAFLFLPYLFLIFNIVVCTWVFISLITKQRQISSTLRHIRQCSSLLSNEVQHSVNSSVLSGTKATITITKEYEAQLRISRKVNNAAIRIALYPLAPLAWVIMLTVFFGMQYDITMTRKSDALKMARAMQINWFSYPATTFLNFLVFLTDPVMQSVINEVRKSIAAKLTKTSGLSKLEPRKNYGFSSTIDGSTIANISITAETIRDDETCSNLSVATEEKQYKLSHADTLAELEEDSHRLLDDIEMHEGAKLKQL